MSRARRFERSSRAGTSNSRRASDAVDWANIFDDFFFFPEVRLKRLSGNGAAQTAMPWGRAAGTAGVRVGLLLRRHQLDGRMVIS